MRRSIFLVPLLSMLAGCTDKSTPTGAATHVLPPATPTPGQPPLGLAPGKPTPPHPPAGPFHEGIGLSSTRQLLDQGVLAKSFNFSELVDLWIRVSVPGMERVSRLGLQIIDPTGHVFYAVDVPFMPDDGPAQNMVVPGMPMNPTTVFPVIMLSGGMALDYPIAIYGSNFTRYPLPGTWAVQATLEGGQSYSTTMEVTYQ